MRTLLAIVTFISLIGCSKQQDRYFILLGEASTPPYDSLIIGATYPRIAVTGTGHIGEIILSSDGAEQSRYTGGGMVFTRTGGSLEFKGKLEKDCLFYVVTGVQSSPVTLLHKKLLGATDPVSFSIDLDLLRAK